MSHSKITAAAWRAAHQPEIKAYAAAYRLANPEKAKAACAAWRAAHPTKARLELAADAVPQGWQLVPMEPTPEMLERGANCQEYAHDDIYPNAAGVIYRAMLDAGPKFGNKSCPQTRDFAV